MTDRQRPRQREPGGATRVWVVLSPGVLLLDLAGIAEPLRLANRHVVASGGAPPFDLRIVAPAPRVRSSLPLVLGRSAGLPKRVARGDWVVLVGVSSAASEAGDALINERLTRWLRATVAAPLERHEVQLWTVCSGALIAASAGLFDGRDATTHHELLDALQRIAPGARVLRDRIYVFDGPVASSAGITAGIDLALAAIERHCGPAIAAQVAQDLVVYWRRAGNDPQISPLLDHRNHLHPAVHRVQDAVLARPAADWNEDRLAGVAHVTARHLRRLFQQHAGVNPLAYVNGIRVALARQRLAAHAGSVDRAAEAVGFSSARQLRAASRRAAPRGTH